MAKVFSGKYAIVVVLGIAALLRFVNISSGDVLSDEALYAFRAIGMMDFDEAGQQTTPLEWYDGHIPWWTHLSFHDHPPLVFLIQHFSIRAFGENNFAYRFPSVLMGIASVYLLYLVGTLLYSRPVGLLGALLLAVTVNHIYISRIGLQEAYVIFFMLLSAYFFLKALKKDSYFLLTGIALGLGLLAKYNVGIMAPVMATYFAFYQRQVFFKKKFWVGATLALLIFSPVIVYNFELWRATGHFDFQFSYIFSQHPAEWQVAPGKEIGTLADRLSQFIPRLVATHSWLFLALFGASVATFFGAVAKTPRAVLRKDGFLAVTLLGTAALIIFFIGPSFRFLTMLVPWMALGIGRFLTIARERLFARSAWIFSVGLAFVLVFEVLYSVNNQIISYPLGPYPWLSSRAREETYPWGYNALGEFLDRELAGKTPAYMLESRYAFLNILQEQAIRNARAQHLTPYPALIVYFGNFNPSAKLMILDRLQIYHGWPVVSAQNYFDTLREHGADFYTRSGFSRQYFVMQANIVPSPAIRLFTQGKEMTPVKNPRGDVAFMVYQL